jgi:RNA polymerase sigma factor (TIGR02999 family)
VSEPAQGQVTQLLQAVSRGEPRASADLLPLVYDELRMLAAARLARTPPGNTLQPTALVHEAYVRLVGSDNPSWNSRGHFFGAAALAMRQILVDQARRKAAVKHGGGRRRQEITESEAAIEMPSEDMLALDEALKRLEQQDERKYRIVMLKYFAGLTNEETAEALGISTPTVEREWRFIRAFLYTQLGGDQSRA